MKVIYKGKNKKNIIGRKNKLFRKRRRGFAFARKKYSSKNLKNNIHLQRRIMRKNKDLSEIIIRNTIMAFSLILLISVMYFLFFSNYFKIKKINLVDAKEVSESQIWENFDDYKKNKRFFVIPADNIFVMDKEKLKRKILDNNYYLEDIQIEKKMVDVIKIKVKEKVISAVWVSGSNLFYIDNYGKICGEAAIDEIVDRGLPAIYDLENKKTEINQEVVTQNFIGFLNELNVKFPQKINQTVKKYWVPSILSREVHLETDDNFKVLLSIDRSVESQLNDLGIVIQEQLKNNLNNVEYIDLRVENWVYYK